MRAYWVAMIVMMSSMGSMTFGRVPIEKNVPEPTLEINDLSIEELKEQIKIYENRAKWAERNADRLLSQDITSSRHYLYIKERNQAIADALKKKLAEVDPQYAQEQKAKKN